MKVLLIGDSCTDVFVYGDVRRLNPEAPVPILEPKREKRTEGMAWNVYNNLNALGIDVDMITQDEDIIKTRYIHETSNQQILRLDEEPRVKPFDKLEVENDYDALVISDYDKGFILQTQLFELCNWFDGPIFIDTKKSTVPGNAFIKVNQSEYEKITHFTMGNMIITRGNEGAEYKGILYPAEKVKVFDVVGAGDTFLAALTYGYLKYGSIEEAIPIANKAAAIAVSHTGTYVLTKEDVIEVLR